MSATVLIVWLAILSALVIALIVARFSDNLAIEEVDRRTGRHADRLDDQLRRLDEHSGQLTRAGADVAESLRSSTEALETVSSLREDLQAEGRTA